MEVYFSYRQLPELARFAPAMRRILWKNFAATRAPEDKWLPRFWALTIIVGMIAGAYSGYFLIAENIWGAEAGLVLGMIPMSVFGFFWYVSVLNRSRPKLREAIRNGQVMRLHPVTACLAGRKITREFYESQVRVLQLYLWLLHYSMQHSGLFPPDLESLRADSMIPLPVFDLSQPQKDLGYLFENVTYPVESVSFDDSEAVLFKKECGDLGRAVCLVNGQIQYEK